VAFGASLIFIVFLGINMSVCWLRLSNQCGMRRCGRSSSIGS